MVALYTTEKRC